MNDTNSEIEETGPTSDTEPTTEGEETEVMSDTIPATESEETEATVETTPVPAVAAPEPSPEEKKPSKWQRIAGYVMIALAVIGILLSLGGMIIGARVIDQVASGVDDAISLALVTLDQAAGDLEQLKVTLTDANEGLGNTAGIIGETATIIDSTSGVMTRVSETVAAVSETVDAINEPIQEILTALSEPAGAIDRVTSAITSLGILLFDTDPGIETSLEEPIAETSARLNEMAESIDDISVTLAETDESLGAISQETADLSENLFAVQEDLNGLITSFDAYVAILQDLQQMLSDLQTSIESKAGAVKWIVVIVMLFAAVWQIVPFYLGWEIIHDRRQD